MLTYSLMQVTPLNIDLDLDLLLHRYRLLVIVVNIYRVLLCMREQLPDLHSLAPLNIWQKFPGGASLMVAASRGQGYGCACLRPSRQAVK